MRLFILFVFVFASLSVCSQNFLSWQFNDRYFSLSVGTGTTTYFGELNANHTISDDLKQINLGLEARLLSHVSARLDASYFVVSGSDQNAPASSFERQRNLSFQSQNLHMQLQGLYYLKRYKGDYFKRWAFDPYVFSGVGYLRYRPTASLGGEVYDLRKIQTEGVSYKKWAWTIPAGIGAKFKVNEFINVSLEASYHIIFTDYLDDVSDRYAREYSSTIAQLLSDRKDEIELVSPDFYDEIAPGAKRGDPSDDDRLLQFTFRIELFLPPGLFARKSNAVIKKPSAY